MIVDVGGVVVVDSVVLEVEVEFEEDGVEFEVGVA